MSFDTKMSFDTSGDIQNSLVEDNTHQLLESLEKKYKNFNKIYNKMKIYYDKLEDLSRDDYDDIKDEV